jgi:hypothetical protein
MIVEFPQYDLWAYNAPLFRELTPEREMSRMAVENCRHVFAGPSGAERFSSEIFYLTK